METSKSKCVEAIAERAAKQFSNWKPPLFRDHGSALLPRIESTPVACAVAELLSEAIGRGYLASEPGSRPLNLLEYCLGDWIVDKIMSLPPELALPFLAECWNLLEGLLGEPSWVNAYALARVRELEREGDLEAFLTRVLTPLFVNASPSAWKGPYRVSWLSLRDGDDEFLPGAMHLVAPTVLAVRDRRRDVCCGVLLRREGQSELAGLFGDTKPFAAPSPAVTPVWQSGSVTLAKERIALPFFGEPSSWIQVPAGFVVASAVDSQKLWIVESAA